MAKLKNSDISKYVKAADSSKEDYVVTSVNVRTVQKEFLEDKNLSLTAIVRDRIDELIKQSGWTPKKK